MLNLNPPKWHSLVSKDRSLFIISLEFTRCRPWEINHSAKCQHTAGISNIIKYGVNNEHVKQLPWHLLSGYLPSAIGPLLGALGQRSWVRTRRLPPSQYTVTQNGDRAHRIGQNMSQLRIQIKIIRMRLQVFDNSDPDPTGYQDPKNCICFPQSPSHSVPNLSLGHFKLFTFF